MPSRAVLSCLLTFGAAAASDAVAQTLRSPNLVETVHQTPGETFDAFIDRVAVGMSQHTGTTGFEACGNICTRTDVPLSSIMVFTGASQIACPIMSGCPLGPYGVPGDYIHSHPHAYKVVLNEQDAISANSRGFFFKKREGGRLHVSPNQFSPQDYELGPGYMVYKNWLWYQNGKGTERIIRTLAP